MSIIDTIQFAGLILSATYVQPTNTVILSNISTPCMILFSRFLFPDRQYSTTQITGAYFVLCAIVITICVSWVQFLVSKHHAPSIYSRNSISILFYTLFSSLQGFSTLYKENEMIEYNEPIDIYSLSSSLFTYQSLFTIFLSPLFYLSQGILLWF